MTKKQDIQRYIGDQFTVHTYSPGDGVTRYRFFHASHDGVIYFADNHLYTALGAKEAMAYAKGLYAGWIYGGAEK